jgi:hypothetical protein
VNKFEKHRNACAYREEQGYEKHGTLGKEMNKHDHRAALESEEY